MPNWCENIVTFKGTKDQISKLKMAPEGAILNVLAPRPESEEANWYEWNVANWGTKWEVEAHIYEEGEDWVKFHFDSAWSPPIAAYEAAEKQGITVDAMYYEPGMNYCGRYNDGDDDYYEIPSTAEETRKEIPEELDEAFNIADNQEMWDDEINDE